MKFRDWGKMAATFVDLESGRAVRISARESSKEVARQLHPELGNKNQQQMLAYRELPEEVLFAEEWVNVPLDAKEFPGYKGERAVCAVCGEGINFGRISDSRRKAGMPGLRRTGATLLSADRGQALGVAEF